MNILHITTFMQGGAGRIIQNLAVSQLKSGHNVTVVMNDTEEKGYENYKEYIAYLDVIGLEYYMVDSTFKRDIFLNVRAAELVNKIIMDKDIDIIHAHAATPSLIAMIAKSNMNKRIPIVQTMHGWGNNKSTLQELMDINVLNLVDRVVTVSDADRNLLRLKGIVNDNIKVIYNGIDEYKNDKPINENDIDNIKELRCDDSIVFGCIGSVCKRKNQEMLIQAIPFLKQENLKVVFIGEGDLTNDLVRDAKRFGIYDKVKFYGYKIEAYKYIDSFDYMILPSLSEGLPLTLLESFSRGKPAITSNIEVFKEAIIDNVNGFIFDVNSIQDLVEVIKKAITVKTTNRYLTMSNKCREYYLSNFTSEVMYKNYYDLYCSVLKID